MAHFPSEARTEARTTPTHHARAPRPRTTPTHHAHAPRPRTTPTHHAHAPRPRTTLTYTHHAIARSLRTFIYLVGNEDMLQSQPFSPHFGPSAFSLFPFLFVLFSFSFTFTFSFSFFSPSCILVLFHTRFILFHPHGEFF
jgi:hypothetical protein